MRSICLKLLAFLTQVELAIQGGRRRADVARVGIEPKNSREKVEAACLTELRALAKKIGIVVFFFLSNQRNFFCNSSNLFQRQEDVY